MSPTQSPPDAQSLPAASPASEQAAGADTGKNGRKLPLRATGDFRMPFVINTYKPENQLFVSRIHKERNIQVRAALYGIVKIIKAQNLSFFFIKKSHRREASRHNGEVCFFEVQVFVYGV
ncbi:hypothetical protein OU548_24190 [Escherichia coli]|nr:hypothetical protein [Escherichia coli]HBE5670834.1 hypothetical protein [Escherichia coli]